MSNLSGPSGSMSFLAMSAPATEPAFDLHATASNMSFVFFHVHQFNSGGGGQTNDVTITSNGSTITFINGVEQISLLPSS